MSDGPVTFKRTIAALAVYDREAADRDKAWDAATTAIDVDSATEADQVAADRVREAFALDTCQVNDRDQAFLVQPNDPWLRALVARFMAASESPVGPCSHPEALRRCDGLGCTKCGASWAGEVPKAFAFDRCQTCGSAVRVSTSREGTSHYIPLQVVPATEVVAIMTARTERFWNTESSGGAEACEKLRRMLLETWAEGYAAAKKEDGR